MTDKIFNENGGSNEHVDWFRQSAPYIHTHRGHTFVILFGGEAVEHDGFAHLINDIALLNSLGVRIVLVHGARPQIDRQLEALDIRSEFAENLRITHNDSMPAVKQAVGQVRMSIEAQLSMGLPNTPMSGAGLRVITGNFVTAQPYGIHGGIDYCQTGNVRNIDATAIDQHLQNKNIVLISPIGYSTTGEIFNLRAEDVATETAIALKADKLIFVMENNGVTDKQGKLLQQLDLVAIEGLEELVLPGLDLFKGLRLEFFRFLVVDARHAFVGQQEVIDGFFIPHPGLLPGREGVEGDDWPDWMRSFKDY